MVKVGWYRYEFYVIRGGGFWCGQSWWGRCFLYQGLEITLGDITVWTTGVKSGSGVLLGLLVNLQWFVGKKDGIGIVFVNLGK